MNRMMAACMGLMLPSLAFGACERQVRTLTRSTGSAVAGAFTAVAACDSGVGVSQFTVAVKQAGDVDSLAAVAHAAIRAGIVAPVHDMLDVIEDYSTRELVATAVGAGCGDPPVLDFVRGLHTDLKDRAFVTWSGAVAACPDPQVSADLEGWASQPPAMAFDNKYTAVVELYGRRTGVDALPLLQQAALDAADAGPYGSVLDAMVKAVTPEGFGAKPEGADREALVASLVAIAEGVDSSQAGRVVDVLVHLEAEEAAGTLLPVLHPDKVRSDGGFLYGVAAVEACDDAAVLHWAMVEDSTSRWDVLEAVEETARGFKPKIKGCDPAGWQIMVTPAPVSGDNEVEDWLETVTATAGVEDPKIKSEKRIRL